MLSRNHNAGSAVPRLDKSVGVHGALFLQASPDLAPDFVYEVVQGSVRDANPSERSSVGVSAVVFLSGVGYSEVLRGARCDAARRRIVEAFIDSAQGGYNDVLLDVGRGPNKARERRVFAGVSIAVGVDFV